MNPLSGLHFDLKESDYHAYPPPTVSSHGLMSVLKSPAHYYQEYVLGEKKPPTPAMQFGSLVHKAVLEPADFLARYRVMPKFDRRTNVGKQAYADYMASLTEHDILVPEGDAANLVNICNALSEREYIARWLKTGKAEASGFWIDKETGVSCRMRADFIHDSGVIIDVKTTQDARKEPFMRSVIKYHYFMQAAFYLDGMTAITGNKWDRFGFLAVETEAPYATGFYFIDTKSKFLDVGRAWYKKALKIYAKCLETGRWPLYQEQPELIDLPEWFIKMEIANYDDAADAE